MARSRLLTATATAALGLAVLTGCNSGSLTDFAVEQAIESQVDGDIDFDFDLDGNGGFNVTTEDGSITFDADGDGGLIQFDADGEEGAVSFGADGSVVFDTDEGSGTVNLNDDGTIAFDTDEGSGSVSISADGQGGSITNDDGSRFAYGLSDAPAEWPSALVGNPSTTGTAPTTYSIQQDSNGLFLNGEFTHDASEDFATAVGQRLLGAGYITNHQDPISSAFVSADGAIEAFIFSSGEGQTSINFQVNS